jgi:hypothetical protein
MHLKLENIDVKMYIPIRGTQSIDKEILQAQEIFREIFSSVICFKELA